MDFIEKAIQSVLNQSFQEFEIIIVDDGSTDDTSILLKSYFSNLSNVIVVFQENSGVSNARNKGAQIAKYEYLAFLDADDWWELTFLENMKIFIETYPHAGLYSSNFSIIKDSIKVNAKFDLQSGFINYFKAYVCCGFRQLINSSSVVIPKVIFFYMNGFPTHIKFGEDFYLWTKIALKEKVAYLNKNLSNYNQDSNTIFRATKIIHNPKSNYIFYFNEFLDFESKDIYLKLLLDHIRVDNYKRSLKRKVYVKEAIEILNDVDFKMQSIYIRLFCRLPISMAYYLLIFDRLNNLFKKILLKLK